MPHPRRCSSPGWMGPWAAWSSIKCGGWWPVLRQRGWAWWSLRFLLTQAILWFYDSVILIMFPFYIERLTLVIREYDGEMYLHHHLNLYAIPQMERGPWSCSVHYELNWNCFWSQCFGRGLRGLTGTAWGGRGAFKWGWGTATTVLCLDRAWPRMWPSHKHTSTFCTLKHFLSPS